MDCTLTEGCPECSDSVLSTTGNVLGLLTFAFSFFLSLAAFLTITRNADGEVRDLHRALDRTDKHIGQINSYLRDLEMQRDPVLGEMRDAMASSFHEFKIAINDIRKHLSRFGDAPSDDEDGRVSRSQAPSSSSYWTSLRWWYDEKDTAAKMAKLESYRQHFNAIQLTLIAR
ncbi:hypothetical protein ACJ41O_001351 [Fusarium nematophilum]